MTTTAGATLTEITALLDDIAAGISTRDADRVVARFAADARAVTTPELRPIGREAIRAAHEAAFGAGGPARNARFVVLDLHLPRPDLAIVTTGAYAAGPDEAVDLDHPGTVVTWTLLHEDDGWWVAARQFTATPG